MVEIYTIGTVIITPPVGITAVLVVISKQKFDHFFVKRVRAAAGEDGSVGPIHELVHCWNVSQQ